MIRPGALCAMGGDLVAFQELPVGSGTVVDLEA
jgi:hypothetical protein